MPGGPCCRATGPEEAEREEAGTKGRCWQPLKQLPGEPAGVRCQSVRSDQQPGVAKSAPTVYNKIMLINAAGYPYYFVKWPFRLTPGPFALKPLL
jgi:hypothetical protein